MDDYKWGKWILLQRYDMKNVFLQKVILARTSIDSQ